MSPKLLAVRDLVWGNNFEASDDVGGEAAGGCAGWAASLAKQVLVSSMLISTAKLNMMVVILCVIIEKGDIWISELVFKFIQM